MTSTIYLTVWLVVAGRSSGLSDMSDIPGSFCATRSDPCCRARQDSCSLPIRGTFCYCDEFCNREVNDDCCPDYPYVCMNLTRTTTPPPLIMRTCQHEGASYAVNTIVKINCNKCKCEQICVGRDCRLELACSQEPCLVDPDLLTQVNMDSGVGWKAANYSAFWGRTLDEGLSRRLGTRHSQRRAYNMRPINEIFDRERVRSKLRYDLRAERPGLLSPPLDQGWCAADWVISTVQVATDRLAIVSKGEDRVTLSPQHLLSCNSKNQRGCDGGHITRAWKFIQKFGLVPEACYPWVGVQTNCSISKVKTKTKTTALCESGNESMSLHRTGPVYRISKDPETIMYEILTSGPVQATMKVSQDFFSYRNGIYQCGEYSRNRRGDLYHAVRIVGWGEEGLQGKLVKYWIVSNSWGTWWGEGGYFRIRRGINDCEIESLVLAAWINPNIPKKDPSIPVVGKDEFSNTIS